MKSVGNHMQDRKNFDVLMAVYIGDKLETFQSAIESVFKNTVRPNNLIIVADGPLEPAIDDYLEEIECVYSYVKLYRLQHNVGLAGALNFGLNKCESELVFRADADDVNLPNRFELQLREFEEKKCDILGGQILEIDPLSGDQRLKRVPESVQSIRSYAQFRCPMNHMSVLFKKSKIIELGGYPLIPLKEDYALWLKALNNDLTLLNSNQILVKARAGSSMIKRRRNSKSVYSEFILFRFRTRELGNPIVMSALSFSIRTLILILPLSLVKKVYDILRK